MKAVTTTGDIYQRRDLLNRAVPTASNGNHGNRAATSDRRRLGPSAENLRHNA